MGVYAFEFCPVNFQKIVLQQLSTLWFCYSYVSLLSKFTSLKLLSKAFPPVSTELCVCQYFQTLKAAQSILWNSLAAERGDHNHAFFFLFVF